jgi:hypothetical protein
MYITFSLSIATIANNCLQSLISPLSFIYLFLAVVQWLELKALLLLSLEQCPPILLYCCFALAIFQTGSHVFA